MIPIWPLKRNLETEYKGIVDSRFLYIAIFVALVLFQQQPQVIVANFNLFRQTLILNFELVVVPSNHDVRRELAIHAEAADFVLQSIT